MLKIAYFCFAIAAVPLWSQVQPSATGGGFTLDDTRMMTPPPVSGGAYPKNVGAESRSNFVGGGLVVTGAYNDNIMVDPTQKIADVNYSIVPTISIDRMTPREALALSYSSGFTLYQKTTQLNGVTQNGTADYRFHLTKYAVVNVRDTFSQNFNLFNQANPFSGGGIPTGAPSPTSVFVYPFQNQLGNTLDGGLEYQYGRNAMIGGGGTYSISRFSAVGNTTGLANSNTGGASAFWSRRVSRGQYIGAIYEYSRITTNPVESVTDTNTIFGFYTKYLTSTISFSILGGPQHFDSRDPVSGAASGSWTPAVQGSVGYQTARTSMSAGYSRIVSGAGGLVGAYHSNVAGAEARRQVTRTWNIGAGGSYALFKNVTPTISTYNPGGHTIAGTASVQRSFSERFRVEVGYSRFHQSYDNFGTAAQLFPDCNREYGSVTYQFYRPIGR
ncbi:MAG: hypothetical protein WB561_19110 [Terracidiphilus sp.]